MGTRAMIKVNGKLAYATHWDGNPESLGKDLLALRRKGALSMGGILGVAAQHSINFAARPLLNLANSTMLANLKQQGGGKLPDGYNWIEREAGGKFVNDIRHYGDWAEYEYDVNTRTGSIKVQELSGEWTKRRKIGSPVEISDLLEKSGLENIVRAKYLRVKK